jgi:hypothetical protein
MSTGTPGSEMHVLLCRNCRGLHLKVSDVRKCLGVFAYRDADYVFVPVHVPDPWPPDTPEDGVPSASP